MRRRPPTERGLGIPEAMEGRFHRTSHPFVHAGLNFGQFLNRCALFEDVFSRDVVWRTRMGGLLSPLAGNVTGAFSGDVAADQLRAGTAAGSGARRAGLGGGGRPDPW